MLAKRHDLIAISLNDPYESQFPKMGLVSLADLESGEIKLIDTSNNRVQEHFKIEAQQRQASLKQLMSRIGASFIQLNSNESYTNALHNFFRLRGRRR